MPELLLAQVPQAAVEPVWPTTDSGATRWAAELHDQFERSAPGASGLAVHRITSWLRVQAIGRDSICVTEPRISQYAGIWAAAAREADISIVRLIGADGSQTPVAAATPSPSLTSPPPGSVEFGRGHHARSWLLDRAEGLARTVIRAIQR